MDLKESNILGDSIHRHWYYQSKAAAVTKILSGFNPTNILDIGAGSGFFTKYLLKNTDAQEGCCLDTSYIENSNEIVYGKPVKFCTSIESTSADLILLMDVLEHIDNDLEFLTEYVSRIPPGSLFLISVPAFQFLWSGHDDFLDHKRRYTLSQLNTLVLKSGLKPMQSSYFFGAIFPLVALIRGLKNILYKQVISNSDLKIHHWLINKILALVCTFEIKFFTHNKLVGLTVFCLAKK